MTQQKVTRSEALRKFIELNPVLIRGVLVSLVAVIANLTGKLILDDSAIENIIALFTTVSALIVALWARPKVITEKKVIAWQTDPEDTSTIVPGPLALDVTSNLEGEANVSHLIDAAAVSATQKEASL